VGGGLMRATKRLSEADHSGLMRRLLMKSTSTKIVKPLNGIEKKICRHLVRATKALGAYEIQSALGIRHANTVYRALEKLQDLGFVHRLESENAFIACDGPDEIHNPGFIVCRECGEVEEFVTSSVQPILQSLARDRRYMIEKTTIELIGRCCRCSHAVSN
jgi:Fur family zinc uptake transcriptional regulator